MKKFFLLTISVALLAACSRPGQEPPQGDQLGVLHFTFTGSDEAMPHFTKGLKLLHNFEFDDAASAFVEAQQLDSSFVMAYWGEALTYNHPLWRQQDFEKGLAALAKLGSTPEERAAKTQTDLERDFLRSTEILYGTGEKYQRDSAYSKYLEKMYETYPGNEEVAAFYALSLLGAVPVGRDAAAYEKSAAIVQGILSENPEHPGALHYLIHSYDDPAHAVKALNAAHSYSKVAADATHALHMPSHIFVAVGMWDEVVNSNIAAWEASVRRMEEKGLDNNARSYHAFHWLMYGLLQQGNYDEARRIMHDMKKYTEELPSKTARDYLVNMKGTYLVETDDWDSGIAGFDCDREDLNIATRAVFHFIEGRKAHRADDAGALAAVIGNMEKERKSTANLVTEKGIPMCSAGGNRYAPNQLDLDQSHVMEMELRGLLAQRQGNPAQAEKWLRSATELEQNTSYSYGPPVIVKPSYELYGEWLLGQGRAQDALTQFERALEKGPKRVMALRGKLEAANMAGDEKLAKETRQVLDGILKETGKQLI